MAKVNVYLPDDLEQEVRDAGLAVSAICQAALRAALDDLAAAQAGDPERGRFTSRLAAILDDVKERMATDGKQVNAHELFGAIVRHRENLGTRALTLMGVELPAPRVTRSGKGNGELADDARAIMTEAFRIAVEMRHAHVGTEHVMLAFAAPDSPLHDVLAALGVNQSNLRRQVERLLANPWSSESEAAEVDHALLDRLETEVQRLASELGRLRSPDRT